jgi:hypothetical protein
VSARPNAQMRGPAGSSSCSDSHSGRYGHPSNKPENLSVPLARRIDTPKTLSSRRAEGTPKIYYGKLNHALDTEIGEMHTLPALTVGY